MKEVDKNEVNTVLDTIPQTGVDPDFMRACQRILHDFQTGRTTKKQFREQCNELDALAKALTDMRDQK